MDSTCFKINIEPIQTVMTPLLRITGWTARQVSYGVARAARPNYITRTQRVRLAFAMSIYGVAVVDGHGNVRDRVAGSGRESDQCDRKHSCHGFHLDSFLWLAI